ncbi:hypothetical protein CLF_110453, partial [Clonorchis sinensis]
KAFIATILDLARKNRNVLFKYMRHRRRNKPSAFSLRDRNGEPTSDPIVVSEFYRDHYAANSFVMHVEKGQEDITRINAKEDLAIWLSANMSFSLHLEKSAQKAFAVLRMIRRTFSRITRTDFQILYGAYVRPFLEYANPVVYSGRTKDVILIERVQRAATKMVAGLKSMDYETRLAVVDLFPLEYRRLRGDLILTYALFEQSMANRVFTVDPANTRRRQGTRKFSQKKTWKRIPSVDLVELFELQIAQWLISELTDRKEQWLSGSMYDLDKDGLANPPKNLSSKIGSENINWALGNLVKSVNLNERRTPIVNYRPNLRTTNVIKRQKDGSNDNNDDYVTYKSHGMARRGPSTSEVAEFQRGLKLIRKRSIKYGLSVAVFEIQKDPEEKAVESIHCVWNDVETYWSGGRPQHTNMYFFGRPL